MNKHLILGIWFLVIKSFCFGQNSKIDSLFREFRKASFYENIYPSKMQLESYQKEIIPTLIALLSDSGFVKLTNTADLIYPGAAEFYGHGQFLPYDIDWISIRAGWLLEDLTFQNFGFKTSAVHDNDLLELMKNNHIQYLQNGTYDLNWKNKSSKEKIIEFRKSLAAKATRWWQVNQNKWNRVSAIKDALKSNDENRLGEVLHFLRFGETKCDDLSNNFYDTDVKPLVVALKKTKYKQAKEQVDLLLDEGLQLRLVKKADID